MLVLNKTHHPSEVSAFWGSKVIFSQGSVSEYVFLYARYLIPIYSHVHRHPCSGTKREKQMRFCHIIMGVSLLATIALLSQQGYRDERDPTVASTLRFLESF